MRIATTDEVDSARHDGEVIGLVGIAHATSHFFQFLLPPLFPFFRQDFGLSYTQVGSLMSIFFVVSGAGQAGAGFLVDRYGARPVLFCGLLLLAMSGLALGVSTGYGGLMVAAAFAGLGNAIFHPADFSLLNHHVATRRLGHAFSVHGLTGNLGWAAAPVSLYAIASATHWRNAGFAAALLALAVAALLWSRRGRFDDTSEPARTSAEAGVAAAASAEGALSFLRSGAVWMCFLFFFFVTQAFGILQDYGPAILGHVYGLSIGTATGALSGYMLGAAAGTLAGGFVAARQQRSELVIALALAGAAGFATLLATGWPAAGSVGLLVALIGFGTGVAGPNRDLLVRRAATSRFGRASYGRVYGFVYSGLDLGLALAPVIFGPLMDRGADVAALSGVAVLQVTGLCCALVVGRRAGSVPRPA